MLDEVLPPQPADQRIDITRDACPMTYVRTRLALDRLRPGQMLMVRLRGEARRNVPRTAAEQGHVVVSVEDNSDGTTNLLLRRGSSK